MANRAVTTSRKKEQSSKNGDNFKVAVRVRPLIERELKTGLPCCVEVHLENKSIVVNKPTSRRASRQIGIDDFGELVRTEANATQNFFYDIIFDPETTQDEIFSVGVKDIVESVLNGYNGSIIASGQTGSGKTHTIEGGHGDQKGVIPRASEMIFQYIENFPNKSDRFLVRVSFLEIYNEKISDLMDTGRDNLRIREDGVGGVFIENLSEHVVRNTDKILALLKEGTRLRTTAATKMNKESSRSHAVFTLIVEHATYDGQGGNVVTIGKLRLVDLAGSERLDVDAQSRQQEETKNINLSLHTFTQVVTALTTPGVKHVPYRDSKLTRILQDCLGGNCKTTLVATITPVSSCHPETLNTLKFAKRAKNIKNTASINKDMTQKALLSAYQLEIKKLKEQLQSRNEDLSKEEMERLEQDMWEARKEKDEVLTQLKAHQKRASDAEKDKQDLMKKVLELEDMFLHGKQDINESEEFKKAVEQEQARIRKEAESKYEMKLAELENDKKRLEDEKAQIEKQKEYFAKLESEMQQEKSAKAKEETDGNELAAKVQKVSISSDRKKSSSAKGSRPIPNLVPKKPGTAPNIQNSSPFPPPLSGNSHTHKGLRATPPPLLTQSRRTASADALGSSTVVHHGWVQPELPTSPPPPQSAQVPIQLDTVSAAALREYVSALAHPTTGIPCQELSTGVRIFTGSDCVKWFRKHMVGVTSIQQTMDVGQRLMDLGVFVEIKGGTTFVISDQVYYQFCDTPTLGAPPMTQQTRLTSAQSLQFPPHHHSHQAPPPLVPVHAHNHVGGQVPLVGVLGRRGSINSSHSGECSMVSLASASTHSGWDMQASTLSLDQSITSLQFNSGPDLLDHYQLSQLSPTELHVSALYGDRATIKTVVKELSVNCLDTGGHTPLMYAVMGRQPKCCQQLLRQQADVEAVNAYGQTSLMLAAILDFHDVVKVLLKNGARTGVVNEDGETVFHLAAKSKNAKCLEYLCRYGADLHGINARSNLYQTPLHAAVTSDNPDNVRRLLAAKADLGVSDNDGRTALHYTVIHQTPECAQAIAETTPNEVNLVDKEEGWSALHLACSERNVGVAKILVECPSCDLNLRSKDGTTPLHLSICGNSIDITSLLLSKGVASNLKDSHKKTALQLALDLGHKECARLISTRGD